MTEPSIDDVNEWLNRQKARLDECLNSSQQPDSDRQKAFQELLDLSNRLLDLSRRSLELGQLASAAAKNVIAQPPPSNGSP